MSQGGTDPVSEEALLGFLREALDPASQHRLKARREANPILTYSAFWKELERDFGRDPSAHSRREWERVSLKGVRRLDQFTWRNFTAEFEFKLTQVPDATEREIEERLLDQLPTDLRRSLREEMLKRRSGQYWVRFCEPLPLAPPCCKPFWPESSAGRRSGWSIIRECAVGTAVRLKVETQSGP